MFGSFGATELIIILIILLLIFGPSRLGDLGSALGKSIKGFKKSMKDDEIDITPPKEDTGKVSEGEYDGFSAPNNSKKENNNQ